MSKENCGPNEDQFNLIIKSVSDALYAIGGKWKLQIIIALFNGNKRFNELQRNVSGISARVLSNELKDLEQNGFLKRKVDVDAFRVIVEYELSAYSFSLEEVVNALSKWGTNHREYIKGRI